MFGDRADKIGNLAKDKVIITYYIVPSIARIGEL